MQDLKFVKKLFIVVLALFSSPFAAQTTSRAAIPESLKPSLNARLNAFTEAQAQGDWQKVSDMLGPRRFREVYTKAHKECLISQMQAFPMTSFTVKDYWVSTEIFSTPFERRWWYVNGEATFRNSEGEQNQSISLIAYRYQAEWYFTPPSYDEYWERTKVSGAELAADHASEINLLNDSRAPLEIIDLQAFIDEKYRSLLNLKFKLRNLSSKRIKGYTVLLYRGDGSTSFSSGCALEPGDSVDVTKMNSSRYVYYCEGVSKDNMIVESVRFSDGSEWTHSQRSKRRSRTTSAR
jgi:hypothetical protein